MGHGAILPSSGETAPLHHQCTEHVHGASLFESIWVDRSGISCKSEVIRLIVLDVIIHHVKLHSKMWCSTLLKAA